MAFKTAGFAHQRLQNLPLKAVRPYPDLTAEAGESLLFVKKSAAARETLAVWPIPCDRTPNGQADRGGPLGFAYGQRTFRIADSDAVPD